ncbi:hypothetical protein L3Q82_022263 [Scortum barcoo]|uniref:Uncharacterized protein n=1 Tax=Scortum barcoo TaxID=214431 RepID=A0ACB8X284_9TELE|nr:hypothetical protein L3Q82_022263 [Scortum barcoo]
MWSSLRVITGKQDSLERSDCGACRNISSHHEQQLPPGARRQEESRTTKGTDHCPAAAMICNERRELYCTNIIQFGIEFCFLPLGRGVNGQSKTDESPPAAPSTDSCSGNWLKRINLWVPVDYKNETVQLLKLAGPVVRLCLDAAVVKTSERDVVPQLISQLMSFLIGFVSMVFCGHLGKTELAGVVALAIAVINVTGISIGFGLASACDTLISQAAFMYQLQGKYLQNQKRNVHRERATNSRCTDASKWGVFLKRLALARRASCGLSGSAAANAISQYCLAVFLFVYICSRGLHKATWGSKDCLQEWGPFLRLAMPSMLMHCLEWWLYEIAGFLAGIISEIELGAQSIVYELAAIAYMFPMGFSVAASVRVGNALGAGDTERAKLSSKVSLICAFCLGVSKDVIGYIFTTEIDIIQRVADVLKMYGFIHVADAFAGVTGGIVRGAGKQKIGAVCNLVGYYFIGFPVGVSLMFPVKMGIVGEDRLNIFTISDSLIVFKLQVMNCPLSCVCCRAVDRLFNLCCVIQSTVFVVFLCKLNWKKATVEALVRAGVSITEREKTFGIENKALGSDEKQEQVHGQSSFLSPAEGKLETLCAGQQTSDDAALSVRQLVVRRGLAVLLMFVILAVGVFISKLLFRLLELDK